MDNEQPDHGNGCPTSGLVLGPAVRVLGEENGDDNVASSHTNGTDNEDWLSSNSINPQHGGGSCDKHDDTDDTSSQERNSVVGLTQLLEDGGSVVEHSVDSCPLLEEHGNTGNHAALQHALLGEERLDGNELKLEVVPDGLLAEVGELLGNASLFKQRLCLDFKELQLNELVVDRKASESRQDLLGLLFAVVVDEPTGREGHEDHASQETETGEDLKADGHKPGSLALVAEGGAADVVGATEMMLVWLQTRFGWLLKTY